MYEILKGTEEYEDTDAQDRVGKLKEKGYLSNHKPKEIKHPYTEHTDEYLGHNISKLTLQITQNCNLACEYCAYANPDVTKQRYRSNKNMSLNLAKKGIKFLLDHSSNEEKINIGFYGGEPLLFYNNIKELIEYTNNLALVFGKDVSFSITTNATILNDEIVEYFLGENIHVLISLDGPRKIHNKNRVFVKNGLGSFEKVMANLKMIVARYPEFTKQISINSVIDTENGFSCYDEFFTNYDTIKEFNVNTNIVSDKFSQKKYKRNELYLREYRYEVFKLYLSMLGILNSEKVSKITNKEKFDIGLIGESFERKSLLQDIVHHGGPCVAGATRLFMDVNGNFFPCERCSELSEVMRIGDIYKGIDIEAVNNITNIGKLTENECINCWNINHCLICAVKADNIIEFSREMKLKSCRIAKKITENRIRDYLTLLEFNYDYNIEM